MVSEDISLHAELCRLWLRALASCLQWFSSPCSKLVVYRITDLVRGKIERVTSIGDNALFINERGLCVSVSPNKGSNSLSSIPPNSIISWHSLPGNPGLGRFGQYDLGTGIWTPASDGDICQRPPPSPHTLIHHILLQSQILVSQEINSLSAFLFSFHRLFWAVNFPGAKCYFWGKRVFLSLWIQANVNLVSASTGIRASWFALKQSLSGWWRKICDMR